VSMKRQSNDDVPNWIVKDMSRRVGRGVYAIPEIVDVSPGHETEEDGLADTTATPVELDTPESDSNDSVVIDVPLHHPTMVDTASVMGEG